MVRKVAGPASPIHAEPTVEAEAEAKAHAPARAEDAASPPPEPPAGPGRTTGEPAPAAPPAEDVCPGHLHDVGAASLERSVADSASASSSSVSSSPSSADWIRRAREALEGAVEVGPVDAWDAAYGEDGQAARRFSRRYGTEAEQNAARHAVWQARLTRKHGAESTEAIGNSHEADSGDPLDTWVDQHNNRVGRRIGAESRSDAEVERRVRQAMRDGTLITSYDDPRIPEDLRRRGRPRPAAR